MRVFRKIHGVQAGLRLKGFRFRFSGMRAHSLMVHAQVFGKTMVCKDLEVATQVMHQAHIDCITIAGDRVSKKGTFTGGFLDSNK